MNEFTEDEIARRGLIAQLFGAFGRVPKESEYAGYMTALKLMPTPALARVVSTWLEQIGDATDPEDLRVPTSGKLWALRRKLKALPAPRPTLELTSPQGAALDGWDMNANLLLLAYQGQGLADRAIGHKATVSRDAGRYAPDSWYDAKNRVAHPGPLTAGRTAVLVKWKNAWAVDMREAHAEGGALDGKTHWLYCMREAEAEIDRLIATERAAA